MYNSEKKQGLYKYKGKSEDQGIRYIIFFFIDLFFPL